MIWVGYAAAALGAIGVAVLGIGAMLPQNHVATGSAMVAAPADKVAVLVREVGRYPEWRSRVSAIEVRQRGIDDVEYDEVSGGDRIRFRLTEPEHARRFESAILDKTLPFGGRWTILLEPEGVTTRLTITEHGIVRNPLFRFVSKLLIGHDSTIRTYLADLRKAVASLAERRSTPAAR